MFFLHMLFHLDCTLNLHSGVAQTSRRSYYHNDDKHTKSMLSLWPTWCNTCDAAATRGAVVILCIQFHRNLTQDCFILAQLGVDAESSQFWHNPQLVLRCHMIDAEVDLMSPQMQICLSSSDLILEIIHGGHGIAHAYCTCWCNGDINRRRPWYDHSKDANDAAHVAKSPLFALLQSWHFKRPSRMLMVSCVHSNEARPEGREAEQWG